MPSRRALLLAGLVTVVLLGAVAAPTLLLVALVADSLLTLGILVDLLRARGIPLEAHRRWPPLLAQGARHDVTVTLRSAFRGTVTLMAREALHPALAARPLRQRVVIGPREQALWTYALVPRRRGSHLAGPLTVRVLGPWGLAWSQRELLAGDLRRVYPQVRWEGRVGRLLRLAQRHELGQAPVAHQGAGSEPYALREYRPGDPPARIHWRASARHARLVSREDTWERGMRLVVLLDCARAMTSMTEGRSKLDHALAAALALTRVAVGRGDRVTLVGFSDRVERVVRLRPGGGGVAQAYGALYDLDARLVEPAYDLALETVSRIEKRRATVIVLTSVVDLAAAELLKDQLLASARRHEVTLVNLEDPELGTLARGLPGTVEEAFAKVSALEILLANRRLARRLRRAGIRIATTPADRMPVQLLETYLSLSGRNAGRSGAASARAV